MHTHNTIDRHITQHSARYLLLLFCMLLGACAGSSDTPTTDAAAQFEQGLKYYKGDEVKQDYSLAFSLFKKAADLKYAPAQYYLGRCYENGEGVAKDLQEAFNWYKKAANLGDVGAQETLGTIYEQGQGVKKDKKQAIEWYKKAAAQGSESAKNDLKRLQAENGS